MSEGFAADWLALREPYDRAARSRALAESFFDALPARPRLIDLGCGTGSNARFLSSVAKTPVAWRLIDRDDALLDQAADVEGDRVRADFAPAPDRIDLSGCHGVTAAALFDLVSADWFDRFVAHVDGRPLLLALNVDGRLAWGPKESADGLMAKRFAADMARDKGFGPAMGFEAVRVMTAALQRAGYRVTSAPSSWRLGPEDPAMLSAMCGFIGDVAGGDFVGEAWRRRRELAIARGQAKLTVGHVDILALP